MRRIDTTYITKQINFFAQKRTKTKDRGIKYEKNEYPFREDFLG